MQYLLPTVKKCLECNDINCFLHASGSKGDHSTENVVYRGDCNTCLEKGASSIPDKTGTPIPVTVRKPGMKSSYWGETAKVLIVRGRQHTAAINKPQQNKDNAFSKHTTEYHQGETPSYTMNIVKSFKKPLERQLFEGILIRNGAEKCDVLLNSKLDHYAPAVGKMTISSDI